MSGLAARTRTGLGLVLTAAIVLLAGALPAAANTTPQTLPFVQEWTTADAPFLLFNLDTTGQANVDVAYELRDLDGSVDNAVQPVALQYRVGASGPSTNVPAGFVADATTGGAATLVTPVSVPLPAAVNDQPLVQVRVITTNAAASDEWVGVDDINVTAW